MDDSPYILDGADASLRKTVSLLNKIEGKTVSAPTLDLSVLSDISGVSRGVVENRSGILTGGLGHVKIFRANRKRTYLFIQNTSLKVGMIVGIGRTPETATSIFLPPNGGGVVYDGSFIPTEDVWITSGGGTLGSGLVYIAMQAPPDPDPIIVGSGGSLTGSYYPYDVGFGESYFSLDRGPLVCWLEANSIVDIGGLNGTYSSGQRYVSQWPDLSSYNQQISAFDLRPLFMRDIFTVSGSYVHNPGFYVAQVNGVYTRREDVLLVNGEKHFLYRKSEDGMNLGGKCDLYRGQNSDWTLFHYDDGGYQTTLYPVTLAPRGYQYQDMFWSAPSFSQAGRLLQYPNDGLYLGNLNCEWETSHVRFDGQRFFQSAASPFAGLRPEDLDGATCVVVKRNYLPPGVSTYSNPMVIQDITGSPGDPGEIRYQQGQWFYKGNLFTNVTTEWVASPISQDNSEMTNWHIETVRFDKNLNQTTYFVNDSERLAAYYSVGSFIFGFRGYEPMRIGGYYKNNSFSYFRGDVAEILIYKKPLSENELEEVWEYLNSKYSIY